MRGWLDPAVLSGGTDLALLVFRLYLGCFLIWGVWDNIVSPVRMQEFEAFLTAISCPWPALAAPASVWAQFLIGLLLVPGLLTRWAGILLAVNFLVAVVLIGRSVGIFPDVARELFGPMMCVLVGVLLATHGAGTWSIDARLARRH
jgi:putative oxidoreductase